MISPIDRAKAVVSEYSHLKATEDNPLVQIIARHIIQAEEAMIERVFIKVAAETQVIVDMVKERAAKIAHQYVGARPIISEEHAAGATMAARAIEMQIRAMKITAGDLKR